MKSTTKLAWRSTMSLCRSKWCKILSIMIVIWYSILPLGIDFAISQTVKETIPAGTPVFVKIDHEISSKEYSAGSKVPVTVAHDVIVKGQVLIQAGAQCDAVVTSAQKAGAVGRAGRLTIQVNSVMSVGGTMIPIANATLNKEGEGALTESVVITILCCILA
ncbi:hypothetical protein KKA00_12205, partial [bacterium]|nr:hypothetical protein [bacterium]